MFFNHNIKHFYNSKSKNGFLKWFLQTSKRKHITNNKFIMDFSVSTKFQEMFDDISMIKNDAKNKDLHKRFNDHVADMMEYTVAKNDIIFSKQMFSFLVDIFMIVGELDYDSVEPVLDVLTTSRIVIKKLIG